MRRVDAYLSRKIASVYPTGLVYCDSSGPVEVWVLEREKEQPLGIGKSFGEAHAAVLELLRAAKNQGK